MIRSLPSIRLGRAAWTQTSIPSRAACDRWLDHSRMLPPVWLNPLVGLAIPFFVSAFAAEGSSCSLFECRRQTAGRTHGAAGCGRPPAPGMETWTARRRAARFRSHLQEHLQGFAYSQTWLSRRGGGGRARRGGRPASHADVWTLVTVQNRMAPSQLSNNVLRDEGNDCGCRSDFCGG